MEKVKQWGIMVTVVLMVASMLAACSSSSSSGKKWGDLSDVEKANAKWAYQAQQAIKGK